MLYDIILVLFVMAMAYIGKRRGLFKTLIGFLSSVIAAILSFFVTPFAVDMLKPTDFYKNMVENMSKNISVDKINESAALPGNLTETLQDAGDKAAEILAENIAAVVMGIVLFFLIALLLKIGLGLLSDVMKLPVLKQANAAGGFVFGLLFSLVALYTVFAIWGCITAFQTPQELQDTQLAKSMFENNILLIFFVHS